ncbi:MAG: aminotransferase class IV, partial [Deltaproteobacteria bacterium]
GIKIKDIFTALFPCGSVTGAPKIKTMEIIKGLEKEERGIYTGAIGYISPQRDACFNVAIRTLLLEGKKGEMGIGGGIVADSVGKYEYEEALLKARFLTDGFPEVSLIESILWESGKRFFLLSPHLKRLKSSCAYFSIQLDLNKLKCDLKNMAEELGKGKWKVRVLIDPRGKINIAWERLEEIRAPVKIKISGTKVDSRNIFLYHKTDRRGFYETELRRARRAGFFETVFLNTKGEVTEGSFTNIFVEKLNHLYTPPVKCGLLPGVLRAHLLRKKAVQEKILHLEDILQADKLYVGNSVRGLLEAEI